MKIYLAVPLSFGRNLTFAMKIAEVIERLGHQITSKWVLHNDPSWGLRPDEIRERDFKAIEESDVLIADITRPSIGVGMEIMYALLQGKTVVCITKYGLPIPGLILGDKRIKIVILREDRDLEQKLKEVIGA